MACLDPFDRADLEQVMVAYIADMEPADVARYIVATVTHDGIVAVVTDCCCADHAIAMLGQSVKVASPVCTSPPTGLN